MRGIFGRVVGRVSRHGWLISVSLLFLAAFVVTEIWILRAFDPCSFDYSSLCEIFTASIIALLGVAITSYIFLHTELQSRKKDNAYMRKAIDKLLKKNRTHLILNCILGLFSLSFLIFAYEFNTFNIYWLSAITLISDISVTWLVWFNISIINHNQALLYEALSLLAALKKDGQKSFVPNNMVFVSRKVTDAELSAFFKNVADIQKLIEKIIQNHSKQIAGTPLTNQLSSILCTKTNDVSKATELSLRYEWIYDYRDLLLVIVEMSQNDRAQKEVFVPEPFPKMIEESLAKDYLADELISNTSLSNKDYNKGNFEGSSFAGSLLYKVRFTESKLNNISFENCILTNVEISNSSDNVKGINFYRAVINGRFPETPKFHYCNFTESDFSKQGELKDIDFELSTFRRANFIGENGAIKLTNINMQSAVCVMAKFASALLTNVNYYSANLSEAEFSSAVLNGCNFERANLENSTFYYSKITASALRHSRLENANFIDALIDECDFSNSYGNNVSFRNCIIQDSNPNSGVKTVFRYSILTHSDFSTAEISNSDFSYATFTKGVFIQTAAKKVNFSNAIFLSAQFLDDHKDPSGTYADCSFESALFDDAILTGVRYCKCDFEGSGFKGAILKKVDFCECKGLIPKIFEGATLDSETIKNLEGQGCHINNPDKQKDNYPALGQQAAVESSLDKLIFSRKSTRRFNPDYDIDNDTIVDILNAARLAPSPKNRQPWKFYVVNDREKINSIAKIMDSADDGIRNSAIALKSASTIIFVGFVSDGKDAHHDPDMQSIGAAVENLILKATSLEVDSLWMCDVLEQDFHDKIKELLGIEHNFVAAILLGKQADKPRKPLDEIIERK